MTATIQSTNDLAYYATPKMHNQCHRYPSNYQPIMTSYSLTLKQHHNT
jgi:hypothetical protein